MSVILDRLHGSEGVHIEQLTFNWRGEPLMNARYPELLAMLRERRPSYRVDFHTNATLITERIAENLMASVAEGWTICVSLDGGSEASHDAHRGKGSFRRSVRGAWRLIKARGGRSYPRLVLHQLDLREPESHYSSDFVELTHAVDEWQRKIPIIPNGERRVIGLAAPRQGGTPLVGNWSESSLPWPAPVGPCFWAGNAVCISPQGEVHVCLLSHGTSGVLGSLMNDSLETIIARASAFRTALTENGRPFIEHCRTCRMEESDAGRGWPDGVRTVRVNVPVV
jgi:MoaA/NifB/PqqE/SkfB family radical SAM enzyme